MRKVKDAIDLNTGEKVYFRGHAQSTYMSDGRTVEQAIKSGGSGEGSYDDTELRVAIADLQQKDKATDAAIAEQSGKLTELSSEVSEVSEAVGKKADEQGYYPNLSVGMADNLLGHAPAVEREIVFDATASKDNDVTEDVARIESIKGNSVVWNQLAMKATKSTTMNGVTFTVNPDGSIIANGTASATAYIVINNNYYTDASHKYAVFGTPNGGGTTTYYFGDGNALNDIDGNGTIRNGRGSNSTFACRVQSGVTANNVVYRPRLIDLTKMFGAGNEPTTIEEFYSRIPSGVDINAYNEGEVIHNYATGLKSVGFNAWDEQWENGTFNVTTGDNIDNTSQLQQIRSKTLIDVLPNAQYEIKQPSGMGTDGAWVMLFDAEKKIITGYNGGSSAISGNSFKVPQQLPVFKTAPNARYMRFYMPSIYGKTYKNDICIHLAHTGYRNGEYAPYWEESIGLPNTLVFADGMKSAGSARDEVYYDRYAKKWRVIKRIGVVDMGTLTWYLSSSYASLFYAKVANIKPNTSNGISGNILVNKYSTRERNDLQNYDKVSALDNVYNVFVKDSAYTDVATFKNAMSGVMLYYELAEPIESDLDDYLPATMSAEERAKVHQFIYRVSDFGTEQMLTEEGVKSSALVADIVYGVDAFRTLVNLRKRVAALEK